MARKASETVMVNRLVWVRGVSHEAGMRFSVVNAPTKPREVMPGLAERWRQEGWLMDDTPKAKPASMAASEGG